MGIVSKSWGDAVLSNSLQTIMNVQSESAVAPRLDLHNTDVSLVTVTVYYRLSDTDRVSSKIDLDASGSAVLKLPDMPAGSLVRAVASIDSVVNYFVTGGSQTCS